MDRRDVGTASIVRANSRDLPLADNSVDLVVTSPPYFALRSYQDGGEHYAGQIGDEPTPAEFVDSLLEVTRECVRVLKPSGSLWVNLGDKYAGAPSGPQGASGGLAATGYGDRVGGRRKVKHAIPNKSLIGIPWRYALRCIDDLGLILRAEVIWSKPNGLPESVTDRVRRSHEQWFHFTLSPRYFSAVDEIREEQGKHPWGGVRQQLRRDPHADEHSTLNNDGRNHTYLGQNPLGKLPGSVWTIPTQPLRVPEHLGVDHFAAFPMEWPRRIIQGWSPSGVCVECGEGRRPIAQTVRTFDGEPVGPGTGSLWGSEGKDVTRNKGVGNWRFGSNTTLSGYACACPEPNAATRPGIVLDPFGGTGTTALVAKALGRHGISVDMSRDYCRLAQWRTNDEGELARAMQVDKPAKQVDGQGSLLDLLGEATA